MSEVPPVPENLPTEEELTLAPDQGRDIHAILAAQARVNGEGLSLVPDAGRNVQAMNEADARVRGVAQETTPSDDPIGDAIEAEVSRIEAMTPNTPPHVAETLAGVDQNKVPEQIQKKIATYPDPAMGMEYVRAGVAETAMRNNRYSLNPFTRVGNLVGSVTQKIGDGMAKIGGGIEEAEQARAEEDLKRERERAEDKRLAGRNAADIFMDHATAFGNKGGEAPVAVTEKVPRPVPLIRESAPVIPPPSGPAERRARESWGMDTFESSIAMESAESLSLLAREIQLQEEELKIQEEELALRRKKLLLLQKKRALEELKRKGHPPVPPKGPASQARVA